MKNLNIVRHDERGVALIMTLSVLSIVLMLAVAFLFSSRNALVVAEAQVGNDEANRLAYSAFEKQLQLIRRDAGNSGSHNYFLPGAWDDVIKTDPDGVELIQKYRVSESAKGYAINNSLASKLVDKSSYLKLMDEKFNHFLTNNTKLSYLPIMDDEKVIGRYGFAILDESGKFDLNAMVFRPGENDGDQVPFVRGDKLLGTFANMGRKFSRGSGDFKYACDKRRGNSIYELTYPSVFRSEMETVTLGGNKGKKGWNSFQNFYETMKGDSSNLDSLKDNYLGFCRLFSQTEFDNDPRTVESAKLAETGKSPYITRNASRFDISGFEWSNSSNKYDASDVLNPALSGWVRIGNICKNLTETWNWNGTDAEIANVYESVRKAYYFETNADEDSTNAKKFMQYMKDNPAVVYNMKDYCDTDDFLTYGLSTPTSIASGGNGFPLQVRNLGNVEKILTGNEAVPYINEVAFELDVNVSGWGVEAGTGKVVANVSFELIPKVELVNIFDEPWTEQGTLLVYFAGDYSISTSVGTFASGTFGNMPAAAAQVYPSLHPYNKTGLFWNTFVPNAAEPNRGFANGNVMGIPVNATIDAKSYRTFSNENTVYIYHTDGDLMDALPETPYSIIMDPGAAFVTATVNITKVVVAYVNQHADADWVANNFAFRNPNSPSLYDIAVVTDKSAYLTCTVPENVVGPHPVQVSFEAKDPRCNHDTDDWMVVAGSPTLEGDVIVSVDNKFFQPNDLSASDGDKEYGVTFAGTDRKTFSTAFIRNEPFRSVWELGAIHTGKPFKTIDLAGDQINLLKCVKIGTMGERRGMMNPNTDNEAVWMKLFKGISLDDNYDSISATTTEVSLKQFTECGNSNDTDTAQILKNLLTDSVCRFDPAGANKKWEDLNDRQREGYLARCYNLLSTRFEMYTIVVYAESLEELDYPEGADAAVKSAVLANAKKTGPMVEVAVQDEKDNVNSTNGRWCRLTGKNTLTAQVVRDTKTNEIYVYNVVQE